MQTPPEPEQPTSRQIWIPLYGRIVRTKVLADYCPQTNEVAVFRRWHGEKIRAHAPLPPQDPERDEWLPVIGVNFAVRLCWYNPARHRIKVRFRWHSAHIDDQVPIPAWRPAPQPSTNGDDRPS